MKIGGATGLSGLWALEWAWHTYETNLRCAGIFRICMPNPSIAALIVFEITAFIRTDRETDMARSTRLVILFKNEYTSNFNFFFSIFKAFFYRFCALLLRRKSTSARANTTKHEMDSNRLSPK